MKRESLIFFLGIAIALLPFLGIPNMWKRTGYVLFGLVIALVGYQLRRRAYVRSIEDDTGERRTDVYVEQVGPPVALGIEEPGSAALRQAPESLQSSEIKSRRSRAKSI